MNKNKLIRVGIKYIRASAFLVLFLMSLYLISSVGNMLGASFYSLWSIVSYILSKILLPLCGGILAFFILLLLAETFERTLVKEKKEEDA